MRSLTHPRKNLKDSNYKEITLLGQNVNAYDFQGLRLSNLISEIEISYFIDNDSPTIQIWNGSIASLDEEIIQLQPMSINFGEHQFYASVSIQNDFYNSNNNN